jgi:tetratricopeptide (TPR) repeat protein
MLLAALPGALLAPHPWARPAAAQAPGLTTKPPGLATKPPASAAKPPASAAKPPASAAEYFRTGRRHFLLKRFEAALTHFQKAYQLEPRDFLLFNIAVCFERLSMPSEAIAHYRRYLRRVPAEAPTIEPRIRELQRQLEPCRIRIEAGLPGSDVWVDGRFAGQLPLKHPIWGSPGSEVLIRVLKAGYHPYQTSLRATAGTSVQLTISQVPVEAPETKAAPIVTILSAPVPPAASPLVDLRGEPVQARSSRLAVTLGVAGTILVTGGLCLGAFAWWKSGQTDQLASWEWERREALASDSRRAAWGADAMILSGAALLAAFGWLYP